MKNINNELNQNERYYLGTINFLQENNENNEYFLHNNPLVHNWNNIYDISEEPKNIQGSQNSPNYFFGKKLENSNLADEDKSTSSKNENSQRDEPIFYSIDKITGILNEESSNNNFHEIIKNLQNTKTIKKNEEEINFGKKKRNREIQESDNITILIGNKTKNKRGRKTNKTKNIEEHDKMSPDNIMKKIKAKIFQYPVYFLNNLLDENEDKLCKLNHDITKRLNRKQDLNYLKMSLKDIFSNKISGKYKYQSDFNKKLIERLLNNQTDNTILFAFNMSFGDWFDIFTHKKSLTEIINKYNFINDEIFFVDYEKIKKSLVDVDDLLKVILDNNTKEYFTLFVLYLYNYERWFYIKNGRKSKKEI